MGLALGEETIYDFTVNSIEGEPTPLSKYESCPAMPQLSSPL